MSVKFYIQDQNGERISLNNDDDYGIRIIDVAGLGTQSGSVYADLEQGFFFNVYNKSIPQNAITGTLIFSTSPYQKYQAFVNWIFTRETLYLVYRPETAEYYCQVNLNFLSKTEMSNRDMKQIPVSFTVITPWYLPRQASIELISGATNTTRYDIEYTSELRYATSAAGDATAEVSAVGHIPAAIALKWRGAISNPIIRLTGVSGKEYGKVEIDGLFQSTDEIELSTRYEDAYIIKRSLGGTETDLINNIDITTNPFFHIPLSEPCIIRITAADVFNGRATIRVYNYHRSV